MSWLKNLFKRKEPDLVPVRKLDAAATMPVLERKDLERQADRLEAEGRRTGNNHLIASAQRIRKRLGL